MPDVPGFTPLPVLQDGSLWQPPVRSATLAYLQRPARSHLSKGGNHAAQPQAHSSPEPCAPFYITASALLPKRHSDYPKIAQVKQLQEVSTKPWHQWYRFAFLLILHLLRRSLCDFPGTDSSACLTARTQDTFGTWTHPWSLLIELLPIRYAAPHRSGNPLFDMLINNLDPSAMLPDLLGCEKTLHLTNGLGKASPVRELSSDSMRTPLDPIKPQMSTSNKFPRSGC